MVGVYEVDANRLIAVLAKKLESDGVVAPPAYIKYVKTGSHVEFGPEDKKFWYKRCASILRQAYVYGTISVGGLRRHYGGRKRHVVRRSHHRDAGGAIIRRAMQQLEKAGLLKKEAKGRSLTPAGRKMVDAACKEAGKSE
ncbi:MAG: 40S ribosomal protein S19 [Candidatus Micrarchaeia archaeon]